MSAVSTCSICEERNTYVLPLHGDKGGPLCCPLCIGKWHGEHGRRRRLGRIVIRAMWAFLEGGGTKNQLDDLKDSALLSDYGIDPLGYLSGIAKDAEECIELTSELLTEVLKLTHPDKHPPERKEAATQVTAQLLKLQPFVFPAPKPPPPPPTRRARETKPVDHKPFKHSFPCADCADAVPDEYCDACRVEWERRQQQERDRETAKQRAQYARRRKRILARRPPQRCASCGKEFKSKRDDALFCSARCRQRAHRKAPITDKSKALGKHLFKRYAQLLILRALKRHKAVFLNDILPPERTKAQYQALCKASRGLEEQGDRIVSDWVRWAAGLVLSGPGIEPAPGQIIRLSEGERRTITLEAGKMTS